MKALDELEIGETFEYEQDNLIGKTMGGTATLKSITYTLKGKNGAIQKLKFDDGDKSFDEEEKIKKDIQRFLDKNKDRYARNQSTALLLIAELKEFLNQ